MKKSLLTIAILLLFSASITNVCLGQDATIENYKWLQGEWRNSVYGDVLDVSRESLQFLKNGLVFDNEEDYPDYERPENINDLMGYMRSIDKVPYQLGYFYDTLSGESYLALLFDHQAATYPFETKQIWLGIDAANHLLFYLNQNGDKVFLDKFSDHTFEEQLALELKEKQEQLPAEIAANQFDWLHGQWKLDFMFNRILNIDGDSIKVDEGEFDETTNQFKVSRSEKQPINLQYKINSFTNEVELAMMLSPYEIFVDKENQSIYSYYDFDQSIGFEKVSQLTQDEQLAIAQKEEAERQAAYRKGQIIRYSVWAAIGVVGIVLLLLLVRWIKKLMPKIKASALKITDSAKEKAKEMSEIAKESKDKLVDKSKELMEKGKTVGEQSFEKIKTAVEEKGNDPTGKKPFMPWLISLLGVYSIIFFDIYIGILLLIPSIIYLILRRVNPDKAEQLVGNIKGKLQPITSKPMLKHGMVALLAGIVFLRTLGMIPGLIVIGLSVVFLALVKFAPAIAQKIDDGCTGLCDKLKLGKIWQNNWVKVAVFALLLIVPILGVRPGQSVYGIMNPQESSNDSAKASNNVGGNQNSSRNKTATFHNEMDVMSYLRRHIFKSSNGVRLEFNSTDFSINYQNATVTRLIVDSFNHTTAVVRAIGPIDDYYFYVYGEEGYVIYNNTIYFAK